MKEQSEESQQEKKEERKEEEGKEEEELLAIDFVPLSDTPTAVPTPVEWADSISFTNYMSAIACNKEGVHEESMADIGEIDTKEGGHTEEEVLQSGLASLAQITKSFVDHIHYLSSKIIHSIKISYLDEEDLSREICFPCRANQIHGGKLEPLEDIQRLKQAVGSNHYIPAHRITELDGLNEVFEELLEDVRLSLYPHEPQISAKLKQLNVLSEEQSTERIRRSDEFPSSYYDEEENLQNKIGSLIVVLPIAHKGGEVVLKFRRENIKLELDKKFAPVVSRSLMHCLNPPETEEDGYYELKYRKAVTMHQNPEVVKARLREHRIRYENHIRCGLAVPRIAFLAYYNEVEEEVEAVEFGVRVSLLYHIFSEGNEEQHKARDFEIQKAEDSLRRGIEEEDEIARRHLVALVVNKDNNQEEKPQHAQRIVSPPLNVVALMKVNSFRVKLLGLLQDSKFMAEGGYLGFPCFHLYEQESDLPSNALLAKKDLMGSDLKLRGADALIAIVGAQAGFKIIFWRILKISAGGEIDFELLEDTLPSLSSARDTYGSVRFIQNSFLGQGVDVEEHLNWKEDSEDELNLESIHWVIDRKEMPRNKVLEGFVTDDGTYRSSTPLGVLNTQCAMLYSVPEVGTSARLAIMKCLMRPLLPRSLEDIQVGYEKDVENRMAQERYEEFVQKEGFFSKAQLEKEATRWGLSPSGTREELESQISDQYFSCLR